MIAKKPLKIRSVRAIFGCFFGILGLILPFFASSNIAYAVPGENGGETVVTDENTDSDGVNDTDNTNDTNNTEDTRNEKKENTPVETRTCDDSLGSLGWLVCPTTGKIAEAVDWLYDKNEELLEINPVKASEESPIYLVWQYCLSVANIAFIIFLLIMVYAQITGVGISNYGVKKALPKLIIAAIMVNLSFLLCSLAVDVSNVIGNGLRGIFTSVQEATVPAILSVENYTDVESRVMMTDLYSSLANGTALAIGAGILAFEGGEIWMLIPAVLGALVAVVTGLITIALRQVVVMLLIMIAPLAIVAYIMPNTESLFRKWKDLLVRMLVFYPMYSLLFGASSLAGWVIIASATDGFGIVLGVAVQIFPLFFSWSLMKMSGTFLGTVNAKITGFFATPLAKSRAFAESKRMETNAYYMQYGKTPYSALRRYLDNRRELREQNTANLTKLRKNEANIYAQRKIGGGFDGTKATGNSGHFKPNKYTHVAKDLSTSNLRSEMATMDTAHALNNYENYYTSDEIRERIKAAEKLKNNENLLKEIKYSDAESRRAADAAQAYLEFSRAQMTKENDDEADFNFMVGQYLTASTRRKPGEDGRIPAEAMEKYRHYIVSSAGGLGEKGQTRVLGKIIAKAAAVESSQRRDINIVAQKFPPDKRNFRNFLFNYYIDDDGYATDKDGNKLVDADGNRLEPDGMRDYLRVHDPGKLVMWDQFDENGPYFDWYDVNGDYVTRIYKKDKSAIKELMSNFDAPINDPINNMLAIHAGIKEQPNSDIPVLKNMGLDGFRTTVGRALMNAPFKEKNAAFSPMVAEMVKKGYIKNYAQEYIAYLDSMNKATKPGAFNVQDADAIKMFTTMMNPNKWSSIFPEELIRGYKNVNGEDICGYKLDDGGNVMRDERGKPIKVANSDATYEELMACIKDKYIVPAAKKITVMMSRQTQNTMDNQKAGTVEEWKKLKDVLDSWNDKLGINPYEQNGDMRKIAKGVKSSIDKADKAKNAMEGSENISDGSDEAYPTAEEYPAEAGRTDTVGKYAADIFDIYNSALDADEYAIKVSAYFRRHGLSWMASQLQDYIEGEGFGLSKEQINDFVENDLLPYLDDD